MSPSFRPSGTCAALLACLLACAGSGCSSLFPWRQDASAEIANDPNRSIAGIQGPTERMLNASRWNQSRQDLARNGDPETVEALKKYDAAEALYQQQNYAAAEAAFTALAKERRDRYESFSAKFNRMWGIKPTESLDPYANFGDPIEEDALFMMAECQFAQWNYPQAEVTYQDLLARYPSTRHLDSTTRKLFRIARHWLNFPENVDETGDASIQLANHESEDGQSPPGRDPTSLDRVPVLPNLTDKTRPRFDTYGRGEKALRAIWLHDATGPLADDALMLAANHNLRTENFVEAARYYKLLREQYPDSPHVKDAFLLGSHVALASYQGAPYDGKTLVESRELKQTLLAAFPDITAEQRKQLEHEVHVLREAEIARLWDCVEFYQAKKSDPSIALYCQLLINKYPDSEHAKLARQTLAEVHERRQNQGNSFFSWNRNGSKPQEATPSVPAGRSALPEPQAVPESRAAEPQPLPETPVEEPKPGAWQRFNNMLRRADQPPQLKPVEESPEPPEQPLNQEPRSGKIAL